jgi:hypothetical protein
VAHERRAVEKWRIRVQNARVIVFYRCVWYLTIMRLQAQNIVCRERDKELVNGTFEDQESCGCGLMDRAASQRTSNLEEKRQKRETGGITFQCLHHNIDTERYQVAAGSISSILDDVVVVDNKKSSQEI